MATTYEELSKARLLIDQGRRLLWRVCDHAGYDVSDYLIGADPALHEVLEQLDEACGATCPRT
jgi:hypothetical protein